MQFLADGITNFYSRHQSIEESACYISRLAVQISVWASIIDNFLIGLYAITTSYRRCL